MNIQVKNSSQNFSRIHVYINNLPGLRAFPEKNVYTFTTTKKATSRTDCVETSSYTLTAGYLSENKHIIIVSHSVRCKFHLTHGLQHTFGGIVLFFCFSETHRLQLFSVGPIIFGCRLLLSSGDG